MFLMKIRHKIGKWIWKQNDWTKAVEEIEKAAKGLRDGSVGNAVKLHWQFNFLEPPNKFTITIRNS